MNSPPILLPGPPFNVPIRQTRVYPQHLTTFSNTVGRQRHLIRHFCSAAVMNRVVSEQIEEQKQTQFPNSQTRSTKSTEDSAHQHCTGSDFLIGQRIWLLAEPKECEADTLTAEPSLFYEDTNIKLIPEESSSLSSSSLSLFSASGF